MLSNDTVREPPQVTTIRNRLCVRVPWERAEHWQARLEHQGIFSTLHLDPAARESHLEVWPGAEPGRVHAALQGLGT
jgi:hypothetical protein